MSEVHPPDPRSPESASGGKRFRATLAPGCPPPDRMDHRQEPQDRIHTSQPDLTSTHGHGHSHTAKARRLTAPGALPSTTKQVHSDSQLGRASFPEKPLSSCPPQCPDPQGRPLRHPHLPVHAGGERRTPLRGMLPSSPRGEEGQEEKSNRPRGEEPLPPGAPGSDARKVKSRNHLVEALVTPRSPRSRGRHSLQVGTQGPRSPRHTSVSREGLSQGTQRSGDAQIKGG